MCLLSFLIQEEVFIASLAPLEYFSFFFALVSLKYGISQLVMSVTDDRTIVVNEIENDKLSLIHI